MNPGAAVGGQSRGSPRRGHSLCLGKEFLDQGCIPEPEMASICLTAVMVLPSWI